jgi:hypothetical protein
MRQGSGYSGVAILCAAIGIVAIASWSEAAVTIAEDAAARAVIVHNGHTQAAPNLAPNHVRQGHIKPPAEELADYLEQITGAAFEQVATLAEAGDRPAIVLELVDRVPGASEREMTAAQAYRIRTGNNRVTLTAATPLGLHNAVYGLLEDHLGCRFYTFSRKGLNYAGRRFEIVPKQPTLSLPAIDDLQEPALANRGIIFWSGSYPWILKNRGIGLPGDRTSGALAPGHNMYQFIPPQDRRIHNEQVKGLFAEHPEIYPLTRDGDRMHDWAMGICGTSASLPKLLAQGVERDVRHRIAQSRDGEVDWSIPFSAGQGDGFSPCHCVDCRKLVHDEQSEAAPLILALNRTLDIVNETFPQARLITFAYFETLDAPKSLKPHDHLWINVVSSARSQNPAGDQIGPIAGNPANRDYARAIQEWPKIAPDRVTLWHWDTYRAEWPSMFYVAENVRFMHDAGVYGINPQFCGGPWVDLLSWLYLKLAWNPDQDGDELIRQFCKDNSARKPAGMSTST